MPLPLVTRFLFLHCPTQLCEYKIYVHRIQVGQALGLSTDWSNHPLYTPGMLGRSPNITQNRWIGSFRSPRNDLFTLSGGLEVLDGPEPEAILVGPRVGIDYASPEHVAAPWRFAIAGTPWISAPKNTLRPR